ncbi:hypothetical protein [Litchfieldella qijiaojingensis]|uniref:hypothetical protein n=1 Tax=Litchfieldella qijiaojingensis TaxID=980347 RepID=UPI001673BC05|nr:hypothetical protein [Halomonas qijiaojingensis]
MGDSRQLLGMLEDLNSARLNRWTSSELERFSLLCRRWAARAEQEVMHRKIAQSGKPANYSERHRLREIGVVSFELE